MSERSYPFDGGEGAILNEADWSAMASPWQDDGVSDVPNGDALKVISEEVAGKILVKAGRASFKGFHYYLDDDMELSYTPNADTTNTRRDLVVLRLDWGTNKISLAIKEGVPGGSTPTPDIDGQTPEMPLASYVAPVNSGPVQAGLVSDQRSFAGTRVRQSAKGSETFPDGTIYYNAQTGRFHQRIRPAGSATPVVSTIPRAQELVAPYATNSNDYPEDAPLGTLAWNDSTQTIMVQSSDNSSSPVWVPATKTSEIKRRATDSPFAVTSSDTVLRVPVETGAHQFEAVLFYRIGANGGNFIFEISLPELGTGGFGVASFTYIEVIDRKTYSLAATFTGPGAGILQTFVGAPQTGVTYAVEARGTFINTLGSPGYIGLGYVNPSATVTSLKGSYISVRRV